jgi:hypothetical protein
MSAATDRGLIGDRWRRKKSSYPALYFSCACVEITIFMFHSLTVETTYSMICRTLGKEVKASMRLHACAHSVPATGIGARHVLHDNDLPCTRVFISSILVLDQR